jgi:hypothetical protein
LSAIGIFRQLTAPESLADTNDYRDLVRDSGDESSRARGYPGARPSAPVTIKKEIQGSAVASFKKCATMAGTKLRRPKR